MARRMLVAGNWKMNGPSAWGDIRLIDDAAAATTVEVAICPPATLIARIRVESNRIRVGGQDCHSQAAGAFTGWLSAAMLADAGADMVIVGHSERRAGAGESNADVRAKAEAALAAGLTPIVCVGESADERAAGDHVAHVLSQLEGSLPGEVDGRTVIAYEPIWAIGTGLLATPADVAEMHVAIREAVRLAAPQSADAVRILYGGSVTGDNAAHLFEIADVDGALVGGASLSAAKFLPIIAAATAAG